MPLPNTRVIPDGWSRHHQPTAESAMRSTVDILPPLDEAPPPSWGDESATTAEAPLVTDIRARIWAQSQDETPLASEQDGDQQDYLVQLPVSALPQILVGDKGHRVRITANPGDPQLEGRVMTIHRVIRGTEAFSRDLVVRDHITQTQTT